MLPPAYISRDNDHSECKDMHLFVVKKFGGKEEKYFINLVMRSFHS